MTAARRDRLSFDDARVLRLESAAIAGHTLKVLVLERGEAPLGIEELRETVAARLGAEPRARQRVAFVPLNLGPPVWVDDADFDLAAHVRHREGSEGLEPAELDDVASALMAERLDHARPLWALDLVGPLGDGRTAIVARIHHAMADGISSLHFLTGLLFDPAGDEPAAAGDGWRPAPAPGGRELALDALRERAGGLGREAAGLARAALRPAAWAGSARTLAGLPGALLRELRPEADESPLDRLIGRQRELGFVSMRLDELKRIGASRRGHVTVNDVLLAVVAGGLRVWLGADGEAARSPHLRAQVPVSLHHRDETAGDLGNRDSFLNVDLPLGEADPLRRLELVNAETAARKQRGDAAELYAFFHALSRFRPLYAAADRAASGPREFSLSISNVPGPREQVRIAGRRVEAVHSFAEPADRHALRLSAVSYAGDVCIGLCTDPNALRGLDRLAAALEDSLAELRAATLG